jgi:hypothetical protein
MSSRAILLSGLRDKIDLSGISFAVFLIDGDFADTQGHTV